jgi:hypothetical protein
MSRPLKTVIVNGSLHRPSGTQVRLDALRDTLNDQLALDVQNIELVSLRYEEYDWVARAGHYIHESPGRTHTLVSDEGMETLFHLGTPIEFLDENDNILEIIDVFWMIDHYTSYCKKHNLPINQSMFI